MNLIKRTVGKKTVWYISYYRNGKRAYKSTKKTKKSEALLELKRFEIQQEKKQDVRLGEFAAGIFDYETSLWIKKRLARGKSMTPDTAKFKQSMYKHIKEQFGDYKLSEIKTHEIDSWLLNKECSNQTKNHILYTFSQIMAEAEYQEIIADNPCRKIEKFADNHKKKIPISEEHLQKLFPEEAQDWQKVWGPGYWGTMFLLMVTAGMRSGEARAMQWQHVLWDKGAVLVMQGLSESGKLKSTKAGYSRGAYVPDRTMEKLRELQDRDRYTDLTDYIFCNAGGEPIDRKWTYKQFKRGLINAELDIDASPHTLRHTYNVEMRRLLAEEGLPEELLRLMIGHKSVAMTDHYDNAAVLEKMRRVEIVRPAVARLLEKKD